MDALETKVHEHHNRMKELHANKTANCNENFKNARVTSCSGVLMKNGTAVALSFANPNPRPMDISALKSAETTSVAQ
jgi:hypothetical protein